MLKSVQEHLQILPFFYYGSTLLFSIVVYKVQILKKKWKCWNSFVFLIKSISYKKAIDLYLI